MKAKAIVNPNSANGRTGHEWAALMDRLCQAVGHVDVAFTTGPQAATQLTRNALKDGYDAIISVGGDGTLNEVINGFFEGLSPVNPQATLFMLMRGTGGDFRKTLGLTTDPSDAVDRMVNGQDRMIDIGRLRFKDNHGQDCLRHFINITSFGMGGEVDKRVNNYHLLKKCGGKFAFLFGTLVTLLSYRNKIVRLTVDDTFDQTLCIRNVAIANGRFHGGGMMVAPMAEPDDGLFEVVVLGDMGASPLVFQSKRFYRGTHLEMDEVFHLRGRKISATSEETVLLDVDGEAPGRLPLTVELVPGAIKLRC